MWIGWLVWLKRCYTMAWAISLSWRVQMFWIWYYIVQVIRTYSLLGLHSDTWLFGSCLKDSSSMFKKPLPIGAVSLRLWHMNYPQREMWLIQFASTWRRPKAKAVPAKVQIWILKYKLSVQWQWNTAIPHIFLGRKVWRSRSSSWLQGWRRKRWARNRLTSICVDYGLFLFFTEVIPVWVFYDKVALGAAPLCINVVWWQQRLFVKLVTRLFLPSSRNLNSVSERRTNILIFLGPWNMDFSFLLSSSASLDTVWRLICTWYQLETSRCRLLSSYLSSGTGSME